MYASLYIILSANKLYSLSKVTWTWLLGCCTFVCQWFSAFLTALVNSIHVLHEDTLISPFFNSCRSFLVDCCFLFSPLPWSTIPWSCHHPTYSWWATWSSAISTSHRNHLTISSGSTSILSTGKSHSPLPSPGGHIPPPQLGGFHFPGLLPLNLGSKSKTIPRQAKPSKGSNKRRKEETRLPSIHRQQGSFCNFFLFRLIKVT